MMHAETLVLMIAFNVWFGRRGHANDLLHSVTLLFNLSDLSSRLDSAVQLVDVKWIKSFQGLKRLVGFSE